MKTSRRNFLGKLGAAFAAMATGCIAAKSADSNMSFSNHLLEKQAKILKQEATLNYRQLSGDFQNLGIVAEKMSA